MNTLPRRALSNYNHQLGSWPLRTITWDRIFSKEPIIFQNKGGITNVKFINDHTVIASDDKGKIVLYSTKSRSDRPIKSLSGHQKSINCLEIVSNNTQAVSCSDDTSMRMWDIERGITLHEFVGHDSYVSHCSTNLTGVTLSCSLDKTVRLFHRAQSTALWHFEPEHVAHSVQFLPAQQFHFLTAHDEYMCLWDMRMLKCHQAFMLHDPALGHVTSTAFTETNYSAIADPPLTDDETDRVWGDAPVPARAPSRDSRATGWASSWLSEFDAMDASVDDEISAPQLNPPLLRVETRAANKDQQRTVRQVYNKKTQQYELPFTLHSNNTYSAQVTPDGLFIVTAARECFKLWNVHDQRGVRSYAGLEQGHHRVTPTFNHSATQLLAGSAAGEIHIWEMYKDKENVHPHSGGVLPYRKYKTSEFAITALALACNDTSVAVADISGQVRIYTASS